MKGPTKEEMETPPTRDELEDALLFCSGRMWVYGDRDDPEAEKAMAVAIRVHYQTKKRFGGT